MTIPMNGDITSPFYDFQRYPSSMLQYKEDCIKKLNRVLRLVTEPYNKDLITTLEKMEFNVTCEKIVKDWYTIKLRDEFEIKLLGCRLYHFEDYITEWDNKLNLVYKLKVQWLKRPNSPTDYYTKRIEECLSNSDIKFYQITPALWFRDKSNGQEFIKEYTIDFTKQLSSSELQTLKEEYDRIYQCMEE